MNHPDRHQQQPPFAEKGASKQDKKTGLKLASLEDQYTNNLRIFVEAYTRGERKKS